MYLEYYGLNTNPFQIAVNPDLVYLSQSHARAKAYLSYSIWKWDGLSVVTGKPGTGKTLMAKNLISRLEEDVTVIYLNHTRLSTKEFLRSFAANLGVPAFTAEKAGLIYTITQYLQDQRNAGNQVLLVIDEAHHLSRGILEEIRFFTALERDSKPLLNIILVGDEALLTKFDHPGMEQLRQRVRLWYSLSRLDKQGVKEYINYRLTMCGRESHGIFTDAAISLLHSFTEGTPRLVNVLCDAAMVAAYVKEDNSVNTSHVRTALDELGWDKFSGKTIMQKKQRMLDLSTKSITNSGKKNCYPKLEISNKGLLMAELILDKDSISIGRQESNDFLFEGLSVCEYHAVINLVDGYYILEDLDTQNGTYINGRKIKSHVLKTGDIIGIATYQIQFTLHQQETKAPSQVRIDDLLEGSIGFETYESKKIDRLTG